MGAAVPYFFTQFANVARLIPRSVAMVWIEVPVEFSYKATASRLNSSV